MNIELGTFIGVLGLLVFALGMLYWQKRLWGASDAARYYRHPPLDYVRFEILSKEPLNEYQWKKISDFCYRLIDAMGLEGGGIGDSLKESIHIEGMSEGQAGTFAEIVDMFLWSMNLEASSTSWLHYNNTDEEGEGGMK